MSFFWRTLDVVGSFHYGHIQFLNKATSNHKNFTINRIESNRSKIYSVWFVYYCSREREREREEIKPRNRCWHGRGRLWCCLWGRHRLFSKSVASPFLTLTQISLSLSISPKKKKNCCWERDYVVSAPCFSLFLWDPLSERERKKPIKMTACNERMKERKKEEREIVFFFLFLFLFFVISDERESLSDHVGFFFYFLGVFYFIYFNCNNIPDFYPPYY